MSETRYRICPICEATCGLEIEVEGREVTAIRGHAGDVFSRGYICPKGNALRELDADPDRLRRPLVRRDGALREASWEEAFAEIERRLMPIIARHGRQAVGVYLGNPSAHKAGLQLYLSSFLKALATPNKFSASTLDQMPKQVVLGLMYGGIITAPVPDIDRCDLLVVIGANPMASNGSLWTVPDFRGRLKAMQKRGGRMIVIDPKRTQTAALADRHIPVRPGADAYLLAAVAAAMFEEGAVRPGRLEEYLTGLADVRQAVAPYTPEAVAGVTGVPAGTIRELAREIAATERAAVYGRMGTCTQEFGTLASWLVEVVNILAGNLDREGGMMFPKGLALQANSTGEPRFGRGFALGGRVSRVRGAPAVCGELPAICLPEEIETPGEGQIRALFTVAGNPVLSAPGGDRLARALGTLDFMVSVDIYLNETTRFADVILPGTSPFEEPQFDFGFAQFSCRNNARYSPALFPPADRPQEWEVMARLAGIVASHGRSVEEADDILIRSKIAAVAAKPGSPLEGRDVEEIFDMLRPRTGAERQIDLAIRVGPYGDRFGADPDGLTLQKLIDHPGGFDLGPLQPRLPEALRTRDGMIALAPADILADMARLAEGLGRGAPPFLLIGRRDVRTNNSWLHNLPVLAKGPFRCTLQINPGDAARLGLEDGETASLSGAGHVVEAPVEITADIMPGVVCLPHGFGHGEQGTRLGVAGQRPGVNSNLVADPDALDPLSGTSVLNGIPVRVAAVRQAAQ
ncbi:MAG: molybdopterin-dependent oxidoreductase [Alphaproteobacteria bacterium]|nr:molybdopterin-dependent oxidoreductase [Alphaproteobacteria bacterium]